MRSATLLLSACCCCAALRAPPTLVGRREALLRFSAASTLFGAASPGVVLPVWAEDDIPDYNARFRGMETPLITGDYYYIFGQVPPRSITAPKIDQPKWNTFGSCIDDSCTYVPIQQRYTAYTKYELRLSRGLTQFGSLKGAIASQDWENVLAKVSRGSGDGKSPAPAVDALLKAGLLASQLLVSPNNLREKKASSLALFYVNEASYAIDLIAAAAKRKDVAAAKSAWEFGRDSWNSYLNVVNPSIVPKVGEPFPLVV